MRSAIACFLSLATVLTGCASVDPTDPSHFIDVVIRNDLRSPVVIVECDTSCGTLRDRTVVSAGHAARINASNEGITVGYVVERPAGRRLGCLYMTFDGVRKVPTVDLSSLVRCR